ncbi:MAG TPA: anti-sigma factor [Croceicoccus sp.]|nr:anti-sigma factor [Croceicoccus sp.]
MTDAVDPDMLAGEYALRVLEGAELADARRRILADPAFAADVAWWEDRLGTWAEEVTPVAPSARIWAAIEASLEGVTSGEVAPIRRGPAPWSIAVALGGLGAAAAAVALYVATPSVAPLPVPAPAEVALGPQLVSQMAAEDGAVRLASAIDPRTRKLALTAQGLQPGAGKAPELWVIPQGGAPVSLGQIPSEGRFARDLSAEEARLMQAGATLAITYETEQATPHAAPTLPIIVAGPLDQV